jgi:PAS domain S-box-containing protein
VSPLRKVLVLAAESANDALFVTELRALGYEVARASTRFDPGATVAIDPGCALVALELRENSIAADLQVAQNLRAATDLPILLITPGSCVEEPGFSAAARPFECLVKPFSSAALRASIELALARHEARPGAPPSDADLYRDLVENSYDLICTHDIEGRLLSVNAAAERALGYPRDTLVGRHLQDLLVPETRHLFGAYLAEILEKGSAHGVMRMCNANGQICEWEYHNSERRLPDGGRIIRGLAHDVTEQLRAARELRASEQRFRALYEQAAVGVAYIDTPTGKLLEVNHKCAQILGYAHEDLARLRFDQLLHPLDLPLYEQRMGQLLQGEVPEFVVELRLLDQQGMSVWVALSVSPLLRGGARSSRHMTIVQDISQRKLAERQRETLEAQLRQAQKMEAIGTLAGGIAHDFNNLLTTMLGNLELARLDIEPGHPVIASLDAMDAAARRATDLIRQILTFSRKQPSQRAAIALAPVIADSVRLLRASLPAAIAIELHLEDEAPLVLADATQIHQVVMNLCTNAWQAMRSERGRIDIWLDAVEMPMPSLGQEKPAAARFARIRVQDTGEGMDARTLERIFEPFFTTKTAGRGSGLGLSVAHGIVKDHGGTITARSRAGEGSEFEELITATDVAAAEDTGESVPSSPLFGYGRVLYVDDEKALAAAVSRMIESLGYRVTVCHSGDEAIARVRENPQAFDVVLTDLSMPGLSGTDVARELMRLRPGLPVILTSGYADPVGQDLAALGICLRLDKPFDRRALSEALSGVLRHAVRAAG